MDTKTQTSDPAGALPTRRTFLQQAAVAAGAAGAFTILPSRVNAGQRKLSPSDKLNLGAIGVGGMGGSNLSRCETENIIALCDVDSTLAAKTFAKYPQARQYRNYREMFDKEKDLDAVIVATPDHTHAVVAMAAMTRGIHVYVQKPIAHAVWEARLMTETARKHKVVTQMGNQGHSGEGLRLVSEWVASGALGQVKEVHAWTNRPVWPQGVEVERPKDPPPAPDTLDWNEWIGPAPVRPFHPTYHPGRWRAWWDFGTGSLGDMGCHILDPAFAALDLKYPSSVEGSISTYYEDFWKFVTPKNETYPRSTIVRYNFPARKAMRALHPHLVGWRAHARAAGRIRGGPEAGRRRRRRAARRRTRHADGRLLRPQPAPGSRDAHEGFHAPGENAGADPEGRRRPRAGLDSRLQGRQAGLLELRLLGAALRDGADGQPRGALPGAAAALGRRGHEGDQRRGR